MSNLLDNKEPTPVEKFLSGANGTAEGILAGSAGAIAAGVAGSLVFSPPVGLAFTLLGLRGILDLGVIYGAFRVIQHVTGQDPNADPQRRSERRKIGVALVSLYNAFAAGAIVPEINEYFFKPSIEQTVPAPTPQNSALMMK